tara:strand:- start:399 stop:533 length:135 start_codon:yes stop_codon:yes gene_type:complete
MKKNTAEELSKIKINTLNESVNRIEKDTNLYNNFLENKNSLKKE